MVQAAATARGPIRVAASQELGRMLIAPWAATFLERYPEVSLELGISDRFVDIIREGFDIAIRMGSLADSDLVSRKIGDIRFVLAASPDYISQNSVPADLEDLGRHVFVRYVASGRSWPYILADGTQLPTSGRFVTDDSGSIREAVICGAGIAYLLHVTVAKDLAEGRLVELLSDLRFPTMPVFAVHAFGRQLPVRAKLFIDSLAERIAELSS